VCHRLPLESPEASARSDIRATLGKRWFRQIVMLEFQREPAYQLEVTAELAAKLAAAPGSSFKVPERS
jgi:hypothetical protein